VAHFASTSAGLSLRTAISTTAAASITKFGFRQPIVVDRKHLSDVRYAWRPKAPRLLSRSPPRASRAGFLPKLPAAQVVNFDVIKNANFAVARARLRRGPAPPRSRDFDPPIPYQETDG